MAAKFTKIKNTAEIESALRSGGEVAILEPGERITRARDYGDVLSADTSYGRVIRINLATGRYDIFLRHTPPGFVYA